MIFAVALCISPKAFSQLQPISPPIEIEYVNQFYTDYVNWEFDDEMDYLLLLPGEGASWNMLAIQVSGDEQSGYVLEQGESVGVVSVIDWFPLEFIAQESLDAVLPYEGLDHPVSYISDMSALACTLVLPSGNEIHLWGLADVLSGTSLTLNVQNQEAILFYLDNRVESLEKAYMIIEDFATLDLGYASSATLGDGTPVPWWDYCEFGEEPAIRESMGCDGDPTNCEIQSTPCRVAACYASNRNAAALVAAMDNCRNPMSVGGTATGVGLGLSIAALTGPPGWVAGAIVVGGGVAGNAIGKWVSRKNCIKNAKASYKTTYNAIWGTCLLQCENSGTNTWPCP